MGIRVGNINDAGNRKNQSLNEAHKSGTSFSGSGGLNLVDNTVKRTALPAGRDDVVAARKSAPAVDEAGKEAAEAAVQDPFTTPELPSLNQDLNVVRAKPEALRASERVAKAKKAVAAKASDLKPGVSGDEAAGSQTQSSGRPRPQNILEDLGLKNARYSRSVPNPSYGSRSGARRSVSVTKKSDAKHSRYRPKTNASGYRSRAKEGSRSHGKGQTLIQAGAEIVDGEIRGAAQKPKDKPKASKSAGRKGRTLQAGSEIVEEKVAEPKSTARARRQSAAAAPAKPEETSDRRQRAADILQGYEQGPRGSEFRNTPGEPVTVPEEEPTGPAVMIAPDGTMLIRPTYESTERRFSELDDIVMPGIESQDPDVAGFGMKRPYSYAVEDAMTGYRRPSYRITRTKKDKNKTDDELIYEQVKLQADSYDDYVSMYPNESPEVNYNQKTVDQFNADYDKGIVDSDGTHVNRRQQRLDESVRQIMKWIKTSFIPIESQYIDDDDNIRYRNPKVETAIYNYMAYMGYKPSQLYLVYQQATKAIGLSPDRNNLMLKGDMKDFKLPDEMFIEALNNIMVASARGVSPYEMVNTQMKLGGTRCYPIGVVTLDEATAMSEAENGPFSGRDPFDIMSDAATEWRNHTLRNIKRNIYNQENGAAQLAVIEDMVRATAALDGISAEKYGVSNVADRGYQEFMDQCADEAKANRDSVDYQVDAVRKRRADLSKDRLDRKRNRARKVYSVDVVDADGEIVYRKGQRITWWREEDHPYDIVRNPNTNKIEGFFNSVATLARFNGVVGNIPIMASGIVEHAQGNLNTFISNQVMFGRRGSAFRPTQGMYDLITTEAGVEAIAAWKALMTVGGQDAVIAYFDVYQALTKENARQFIDDYVKRVTSDNKLFQGAKYLGGIMQDVTKLLMPGDAGFGKADAKRWLEGFMLNMMIVDRANQNGISNAATGEKWTVTENSFSSSQVYEMMQTDGIERFMAWATSTNAGRDAMIMTRNQTLARESPLTHAVDVILRSNGITNFAITMGIDTYFTYGLNLMQAMFPFSNTMSYLIVRGLNRAATGGVADVSRENINVLNYQMGGNDRSFARGLYKNIVYDIAKLGNICLIQGFFVLLLFTIGFDEPEDESLKYNWNEYLVGGKIGMGPVDPETGEHTGLPVYAAWWLNDLTMFGLPAAYAIAARSLDQKLGDYDPDLSTKLFIGGCYDMVSGASLLDMIKVINNAKVSFDTYAQMMDDPNYTNRPPDWNSYALMQAELFCARAAGKMVPSALKNWRTDTMIVGESALDHDAYTVYDRSENADPGDVKSVEDWFELQRRIESKYNPLYAIWNNKTKNGYFFDDGSTGLTGYLFDEMPINTMPDPARMSYASLFDYDPDNIPGGEANRAQAEARQVEKVLAEIDKFNSVDEAVNHGFFIPGRVRALMRDYCYRQINAAENVYNYNKRNGLPYDYMGMQNTKQKYYNYVNNWVFTDRIPWSDRGYAKLLSDSQVVYYRKSNGAPATAMDYWIEGGESIGRKSVPKGNHPTSFALFTTADSANKGYNFETIPSWFNPGESGTDTQRMFDRFAQTGEDAPYGTTVPYGKDAGVQTNAAIFGGSPTFLAESPEYGDYKALDVPTIGYRGYVPYDAESMLKELKNVKREDITDGGTLGEMGAYRSKESWNTSSTPNWGRQSWPRNGVRRYSSYSYAKSSPNIYNPKIYSNSKTIYADKAAAYRTQRPYNAVESYLRPSFATKGSREAYRRQDM